MNFSALELDGVKLIRIDRLSDERGFFARLWCREEFARAGVQMELAQASASYNAHAGTLRGMHFAWPPATEAKIVRCASGRMLDVLLDLRPESPQFLRHVAVELDADSHDALYVPPGVAHGFQTLVDATEVHYMMSQAYQPTLAAGFRHDDPAFGIRWPLPVHSISPKDQDAPVFVEADFRRRHAAAREGSGHAA
jgi:dTDP-4-dehydrorhamnose 3,5-epimerase